MELTIPEMTGYATFKTSSVDKEATIYFYADADDVLLGSWVVPYLSTCEGMDRFNAILAKIGETVEVLI
jgi:hypothetical protein